MDRLPFVALFLSVVSGPSAAASTISKTPVAENSEADRDPLGFRSVGAPRKILSPSGCEVVIGNPESLLLNELADLEMVLTTRKDGDGLVEFDARMPAHGHGMVVTPKILRDGSGRRARISGVKFHMRGYWELTFRVRCNGREELAHATCHSDDEDARRPFRCL